MKRRSSALEFEDDGASFRVRQMWKEQGRNPVLRWWRNLPLGAKLIAPWLLVAAFLTIAVAAMGALILLKKITG